MQLLEEKSYMVYNGQIYSNDSTLSSALLAKIVWWVHYPSPLT